MENINIFDLMYDEYKINKPIRLIECFAGYGSQSLALKYLGANFEHYKICEWAVNSIIAYASLHRNELENYGIDCTKGMSKEFIAKRLFELGVSVDYNSPAKFEQLKRMNEEKLRLCLNSIMWSNNLVDVSRVKGKDLCIEDTKQFTYLLTYSFPCQDLSLRGNRAGMEKGSGTRSGLLWEVERILTECENKPQILLMENVTQVHGAGNDIHFKEWQLRLEELGYQSYWEDMSAVDYGIPQTRNRTFMVSILGNYNYKFPKKSKLNLKLKDLLESNVDEKYYISEKMVNYISQNGGGNFKNPDSRINLEIARPLTTEQNKRAGTTNYLCDELPENYDLSKPAFKEVYEKLKNSSFQQQRTRIQESDVCDTLLARDYKDPKLVIENLGNKNLKDTLKQNDISDVDDVAYIDAYNKKIIKDGTAKTILTGVDFRNQDFLIIKDKDINYTEKSLEKIKNNVVDENDVSGSLTATGMQSINHDGCQLVKTQNKCCKNCKHYKVFAEYSEGCELLGANPTYFDKNADEKTYCCKWFENKEEKDSIKENKDYSNLRIRKLTPRECFRLMGVKDDDIDLLLENQTNSSAWHLAGDSIVVNCLMAIFSQMVNVNWQDKFIPGEWWKND